MALFIVPNHPLNMSRIRPMASAVKVAPAMYSLSQIAVSCCDISLICPRDMSVRTIVEKVTKPIRTWSSRTFIDRRDKIYSFVVIEV